jgi:antitoxin component of MazEF toxin-antitoxin module
MIKKIQKIGNSQGIILDKTLLKLLNAENDRQIEIIPHNDGLLLKKAVTQSAYQKISQKHRKSLDKLGQ